MTGPRPLSAEEMDELRAFLDKRLRLAPVYAMIGGGQDFGRMRRLLATLDDLIARHAALVAAAREWAAAGLDLNATYVRTFGLGDMYAKASRRMAEAEDALRAALDEEER